MRTFATLLAGFLAASLVALAAPAVAHYIHSPCGQSTTQTTGDVHTDVWAPLQNPCVGVVVSTDEATCINGIDEHHGPVHVLVLYNGGCQTGVIVELPPLP